MIKEKIRLRYMSHKIWTDGRKKLGIVLHDRLIIMRTTERYTFFRYVQPCDFFSFLSLQKISIRPSLRYS